MEAVGLVPSQPDLRPADVLTRAAIPNRLAALDIGIKNPDATGAGADCVQTMHEDKLKYYSAVLPELEHLGITYCPVIFSCYGRRHGTTSKIMFEAASRAARFRGFFCGKLLLQRWQSTATAEIWRRAARMVKANIPKCEMAEALMDIGLGGWGVDEHQPVDQPHIRYDCAND